MKTKTKPKTNHDRRTAKRHAIKAMKRAYRIYSSWTAPVDSRSQEKTELELRRAAAKLKETDRHAGIR